MGIKSLAARSTHLSSGAAFTAKSSGSFFWVFLLLLGEGKVRGSVALSPAEKSQLGRGLPRTSRGGCGGETEVGTSERGTEVGQRGGGVTRGCALSQVRWHEGNGGIQEERDAAGPAGKRHS